MAFILDLLFPKLCIGCNSWGTYLCKNCFNSLQFLTEAVCPYCALRTPTGETHERCQKKWGIDGSLSIMKYNGVSKKIIKRVKYSLVYAILEDYFSILPNEVIKNLLLFKEKHHIDYLQPVPLHKSRENLRGFNQSALIANVLKKKLNIPLLQSIERNKDTKPQAQLNNKKEREENIKGAFSIIDKGSIQSKNIVLVDDLITSGSTCDEACRILKQNGANKVYVLTLAHG